MALTKSYYSIDGEIIGEAASSVRTGYLPDALGSITATVDESGSVVNTYRYKPYGAQLSKSGEGADPKFQWTGNSGSLNETQLYTEQYNRARYYSSVLATWITIDPLASKLLLSNPRGESRRSARLKKSLTKPYLYCDSNPVNCTDPSGLDVEIGPVPVGEKCADYPNSGGVTWCNFVEGKPWTLLCHGRCDAPCTDAHEGQHRYDHKVCCARLIKCYRHHSESDCQDRWYDWVACNKDWRECRAYRSGRLCREKMIAEKDCWNKLKENCTDKCCDDLINAWNRDNSEIDDVCTGINPGAPPPCKCPFKSDGNYV